MLNAAINKNIEKEHTFMHEKRNRKTFEIPLAIEYGKRLTQDWKKQPYILIFQSLFQGT